MKNVTELLLSIIGYWVGGMLLVPQWDGVSYFIKVREEVCQKNAILESYEVLRVHVVNLRWYLKGRSYVMVT